MKPNQKPRPLPLYHGTQRLLFKVERVNLKEIDRVLAWMKKARAWRLKVGSPK